MYYGHVHQTHLYNWNASPCYLCTPILTTKIKVASYAVLTSWLIKLVSISLFNFKTTPTNDTDYSYHKSCLIIWGPYHATSY